MIIDAHAHIGGGLIKRQDDPEDALVAAMDTYGVDKAIAFPIMPLPLKDPQATENTRDKDFKNEWVIRAVKKHPGRLFGALCPNPWKGDDLEDMLGGKGIVCLKIHPMLHSFKLDDEIINPMIEKAIESEMPVFVHSGPGASPLEIGQLASKYPEATIIIGHMGGCIEHVFESIQACLEHKNLFIETSTILPAGVKFGVRSLGAKRFLFGSEFPTGSHYAVELPKFDLIDLTEREKELILYQNAARLFRL